MKWQSLMTKNRLVILAKYNERDIVNFRVDKSHLQIVLW